MNTQLREGIDWVGFVDWSVRDFHGYATGRGSTYNAYLVRGTAASAGRSASDPAKTALIDAVKAPFAGDLLRRVANLTPLEKLDYIVCNHAEPDHAGALPAVVAACPQAEVVCNKVCREALGRHFDTSAWRFHVVADGDSLSLGRRTLTFVNTPMAHWPESMMTYVPEDKVLFSMDAFGQHYASSARFDDEAALPEVMDEARTYYANILMPLGKPVLAAMAKASGLAIEIVAPSHGIVWRSHIADILKAYGDWTVCRARPKVLVIYDTMWGSTDRMARAIEDGAASVAGVEVKRFSVRLSDTTVLATEVLDAATLAIGSSTLNRTYMPQMGALLTYLECLRPVGKAALAFGSYGWSRGACAALEARLGEMKVELLAPAVESLYVPTAEALEQCRQAGRLLGEKALAAAQAQAAPQAK
jgi:flavorubredoxin